MVRRRGRGSADRTAGIGLLTISLAMAAGGIIVRHLALGAALRTFTAGAVPWAFTAIMAVHADFATGTRAPADQFAHDFWCVEMTLDPELLTPGVRAALSTEQVSKLRDSIMAARGALIRVDPMWHEDSVEPPGREEINAPVAEIELLIGPAATGLPGTLSIPPGDGPFPGIVLVHGSGPNDRDETVGRNKPFRDLAWGLAERGIVVLRYDKRSFSRPADLAAVGNRLTVREEVIDDARQALTLLRQRSETDPARVYVLGHSLGGTLAPRIAAAVPRPAGMVILAGSTLPLPEKILKQITYIAELDGSIDSAEAERIAAIAEDVTAIRRALDGDGDPPPTAVLGAPFGYYRDLEGHDPTVEAANLGLPTLVLQGGRDYQVTMDDFARWKSALAGRPGACLTVYDDLGHLFRTGEGPSSPADYARQAPVAERVISDIAKWLQTHACPGKRPDPRPRID